MTTIRRNKPIKAFITADIRESLSREDLCEVEASWCPGRAILRRDLLRSRLSEQIWPQHLHWNWGILSRDLTLPGRRCDALRCEDSFQAIALSVARPRSFGVQVPAAATPEIVYLDYIEVAPWNLRTPVEPVPTYSFVGARLVQHLVRLSMSFGFDGRLGLHSLPQSEPTYREWGMADLGLDSGYDNLAYFEFSPVAAAAFVERDCY